MNQYSKDIIETIRAMDSSPAADWLIENQQGNACIYASKRTWKKEDQVKLAAYYLKSAPHTSGKCYDSLLTIMPIRRFISVLKDYLPTKKNDIDLLCYYLYPALEKHVKNDKDKAIVADLKNSI